MIAVLIFAGFALSSFFVFQVTDVYWQVIAQSFLEGKMNMNELFIGSQFINDFAIFEGRVYFPLGPLPALMFIPFMPIIQLLDIRNFQSIFVIAMNTINIWLLFSLARKCKLTTQQALWMVLAFFLGSVYIGVAFFSLTSYVSHVLATLWVLAALNEFFGRRRYWFIGLLMSFAFATRQTAGLGIAFFMLYIFFEQSELDIFRALKYFRTRSQNLLRLLLPFALMVVLLMMYNFVRFHNIFESGYSYQLITGTLKEFRDIGVFHIHHVLFNVYHSLFALPRLVYDSNGHLSFPFVWVSGFGMSMLFTSPYLVWLRRMNFRDPLSQKLLITVILIFGVLMAFFASGTHQYGYRYSLDFLPYLFTALMFGIASGRIALSKRLQTVIMLSVLVNLYFVIFSVFPIFTAWPTF